LKLNYTRSGTSRRSAWSRLAERDRHAAGARADAEEFIALAKSSPAGMNFGSGGSGTSNHLAGELFTSSPHEAGPRALQGREPGDERCPAGSSTLVVIGLPAAAPPHQVRAACAALGVIAPQRLPACPRSPTVAEAGLPDFESRPGTACSRRRYAAAGGRTAQHELGDDPVQPGKQGQAESYPRR